MKRREWRKVRLEWLHEPLAGARGEWPVRPCGGLHPSLASLSTSLGEPFQAERASKSAQPTPPPERLT